jgi:hypothetical protein
MKFHVQFHDIRKFLASNQRPVFLIPRPVAGDAQAVSALAASAVGRTGTFWVPGSSLLESPVKWSMDRRSDNVPVPMFAYSTPRMANSQLIANGIELGWRALASLKAWTRTEPIEATILLGHECPESERGFDYYLGILIRTE